MKCSSGLSDITMYQETIRRIPPPPSMVSLEHQMRHQRDHMYMDSDIRAEVDKVVIGVLRICALGRMKPFQVFRIVAQDMRFFQPHLL